MPLAEQFAGKKGTDYSLQPAKINKEKNKSMKIMETDSLAI